MITLNAIKELRDLIGKDLIDIKTASKYLKLTNNNVTAAKNLFNKAIKNIE